MSARQGIALQMHPGVYPYLITRIVPAMYHIIILPKGQQTDLVEIARTQMFFNKLESCLVLSANEGIYLYPDGSEARSSHVPFGGILMYNQLKPCRIFSEDQELRERKEFLEKHIESLKQGGYSLGDTTKGGKKPTAQEADNLRGRQENGVPKGLVPCPKCGEWRGTCLDLIHDLGEYIVRVSCLCENDNRCAGCGDLLCHRKLNGNEYDPKDGRIWHLPAFSGFGHICKLPALNQKQIREVRP